MRPARARWSESCLWFPAPDHTDGRLATVCTLRPLASSNYIPSRKLSRYFCWNVHIVDNNFWAILAPEECRSTLEKVSFMSERALLRRSLLLDLRPVPRLLRRNSCQAPASETTALKAGSGFLTMEIF